EYNDAIKYFGLAGSKFPLTDWYLAELYYLTYQFEESVQAYQNFIATLPADDKKLPELELQKSKAELGAKLIRRIEDISIIDSMVVDKNFFLKKYNFNSELGTLKQSKLTLKTRENIDKISYTTQRGDRTIYSDTIKGQTDILSSFKQLDDWSTPVSISEAVNTEANENYPFLLLDGLTLYFASDGKHSLGGYDIFITKYSSISKGFLAPENIGFPFNSTANDYMMVIDELQNLGWFATDRNQASGKIVIYKFVPNAEKIIYRTENKDTLENAAKLKLYRKTLKIKNETTTKIQDQNQPGQEFKFIVNDSLIYTHFEDFKSNIAFKIWSEYNGLEKLAKIELANLAELRAKYESTLNENERKKMGKEIQRKEVTILDLQLEIAEKNLKARNEEIIFLNKN
ncbi:MAG TPA: hypothetical protein P5084_09365, partial [Paludibacter sp.]|nr:hypothetical protein [Paludibacter sp.]